MKTVYVNQLPPHVQAVIRREMYRINCEWYGVEDGATKTECGLTVEELVEECGMCSKINDVIGCEEEGLLSRELFGRWA